MPSLSPSFLQKSKWPGLGYNSRKEVKTVKAHRLAPIYGGGNQEAKAGAREEPRELAIPAPALG